MIVISMLGGAVSVRSIVSFCKLRISWLQLNLNIQHNVPSRHTFLRVLENIKSDQLSFWIQLWRECLLENKLVDHIAIDGKQDNANNYTAIRAYDSNNKVTLAHETVTSDTNEIMPAQKVLTHLNLKDVIVTADAMHAQRKTARIIMQNL